METTLNPSDITCCICFELFTNPKILPCVHTFCEKCIASYIEHDSQAAVKKGFPCPTCRQLVKIPDPSRNMKEWASQLKSNFFMKNLIDSLGTKAPQTVSDVQHIKCAKHLKDLDLMCVDCDTQVCANCVAVAHRTCRQVCTIKEVAEEKREATMLILQAVDARLQRNVVLEQEWDKELKSLAQGKEHCLLTLNTRYHSMRAVLEKVFQDAKEDLVKKYSHLEKKLTLEKSAVTESRSKLQEITREGARLLQSPDIGIVSYSALVLPRLDTMLSEHSSKDPARIGSITSCRMLLEHKYQNHWSQFPLGQIQVTETKRTVELPVVVQMPLRRPKPLIPTAPPEVSRLLGSANAGSSQRNMQPGSQSGVNSATQSAIHSPLPTSLDSPTSPHFGSTLLNPATRVKLGNKVSVKVKEDKSKPQIRDLTILSGNVVVLTDGDNNAVKSFYTQTAQLQYSRYIADGQPHGVTLLSGNTVAVTVPRQRAILLLNVTPNIFLQKTVATSAKYWAITAVTPEALAVSVCPGSGPASVELIDLQGKRIRVIRDGILANPLHMCCSPTGDIIITDPTVQPGIVCLRQNGYLVFKYEPRAPFAKITRPMGVSVDKSGAILVVNQHNNSVVLLDPEGDYVYQLLQMTTDKKKLIAAAVGERGYLVCAQENQLIEYNVSIQSA